MEKEIFTDFNIGSSSGPEVRSGVSDVEDVKKEEDRLKRNSNAFLITGILTLLGGAAVVGGSVGLISGILPSLAGIGAVLGISAALFGGISVLRNVFRRGSLEFPRLKMLRKTTESMTGSSYRPFEETTFASRRLAKSDDKVFFGVCSGLAEYAGVSPGLMRMAFVLAFLFSGGAMLLPYIILAFALPVIRRNTPA